MPPTPSPEVPLTDADLAGLPTLVHGQTFEEMVVGSRFRTASRTITETDLVTFVTLTGMNEPLFLDEAGSLDAGYAGRLVPGALVFSYAEGLVMQTGVIHGTGMAFLRADVSVQAPVFVGDTITVVGGGGRVTGGLDRRAGRGDHAEHGGEARRRRRCSCTSRCG